MILIARNKAIGTGRNALFLSLCILILTLTGCKNDHKMLSEDRTDSAYQVVNDAHVRRSENAQLQIELDAPLIEKYDLPRPITKFYSRGDQRVQLRIYGEGNTLKASIEADYAISYDDRDIMEAYDSVVVIDYKGGDTILLQDLIWNSAEDRIYSEHPVRARNGNRLTEGDGFTSNQRMDDMHIIRQRGVIEFND